MKFAKLSSAKMIALLIRQTLVPPTFRHLRYLKTAKLCPLKVTVYMESRKRAAVIAKMFFDVHILLVRTIIFTAAFSRV